MRDGIHAGCAGAVAIVSICLGGSAAAVTRYLVGNADAPTLALLRWSIGFAVTGIWIATGGSIKSNAAPVRAPRS